MARAILKAMVLLFVIVFLFLSSVPLLIDKIDGDRDLMELSENMEKELEEESETMKEENEKKNIHDFSVDLLLSFDKEVEKINIYIEPFNNFQAKVPTPPPKRS